MVQQERISCSAGPPAFSYSATFSDLERLYIRNWKSQGICPPRRQQMADLAIVVVVVIFPTSHSIRCRLRLPACRRGPGFATPTGGVVRDPAPGQRRLSGVSRSDSKTGPDRAQWKAYLQTHHHLGYPARAWTGARRGDGQSLTTPGFSSSTTTQCWHMAATVPRSDDRSPYPAAPPAYRASE